MKSLRCIKTALAAALVATAFAAGTASADPVNIRVGYSSMPAHLIPTFYAHKEALKHYGKSYTVKATRFHGSTPQLTALAAGDIDFAALSPTALVLGVLNANLDVKVVADIIQDGMPGHYSQTIYVKTKSGINKPADLKGHIVGINAAGSAVDMAVRTELAKYGLAPNKDYRELETSFSSMLPMLEDDKIDAGPIVQPLASQMVKAGKYKVLFSSADAIGPTQFVFLVARTDFLKKHHDAAMDFMEDHVRGFRWISDPANRAAALPIIAKASVRPLKQMSYLFSDIDYYRDPYLIPNIPNLQRAIDAAAKLKVVPEDLKVAPKYVDLSFIEEAKKRIEAAPK